MLLEIGPGIVEDPNTSSTPAPRLSRATKISYGVGQASEGIKNGAFSVFLFFYYAQVLGLSTTYTGLAVFIALVVDAIAPLVVWRFVVRWREERRKQQRPWAFPQPRIE